MSDLIDREALLRQIDIDSEGEPGYYGDTWKFIDTIKRMPSALGTNLAEVGMDAISREQAIDALKRKQDDGKGDLSRFYNTIIQHDIEAIKQLPPIQPEIIRCKDCKNWDTTWTNDFSPNYHYCPMVDGVRKEDWYCADAEKREVDNERK